MAEQFIGVEVMIWMKTPPNAQIHGLVAGVSGQQLTLHDVFVPFTGAHLPVYTVEGDQIADLEVAPRPQGHVETARPAMAPIVATPLHHAPHAHLPSHQHTNPPPPHQAAHLPPPSQPTGRLVDPAILSMGRKPTRSTNNTVPQVPQELLADVTNPRILRANSSISPPTSAAIATPPASNAQLAGIANQSSRTPTATLTAPFSSLNLTAEAGDFYDTDDAPPVAVADKPREPFPGPRMPTKAAADSSVKKDGYTGKRSRRGGKSKAQKDAVHKTPPHAGDTVDDIGSSPVATRRGQRGGGQNKPWRHSIVSEEQEVPEKRTPGVIGGTVGRHAATGGIGHTRRSRASKSEQIDGWATEDAGDIQGLGEFDFAGNLSKFDKKTVFNQIKADDTTADEARLVSHNRLQPRAGTAGGKNLHHTEMVLEAPNGLDKWNSEAGDSDEDREEGSGRSSRRAVSRQSAKQVPSRKGSAMMAMSSSGMLHTSLGRQHFSPSTASPRGSKFSPAGSPMLGSTTSKPSLRIHPSGRLCPVVNPLQMLDVERIAEVELGMSEDMMTENAGRGVAEVALSALNPGGRRVARGNHNAMPLVVVLAGNNKSGARAVAGGRHLRNHEVRVMICVLGLEREDELLESIQRQLKIFRNTGGKLSRWDALAANLKALESPPELIVDALLGMHISFEDLRTDDQATAYELIQWANKSKAGVLAVDVPSGIDASTGEISALDGEALYIQAKFVVAMGAPKQGILHALMAGEGEAWQVSVADIGISNTAWRKYGTRRRHGVEFANEWVVGLRYRGVVE